MALLKKEVEANRRLDDEGPMQTQYEGMENVEEPPKKKRTRECELEFETQRVIAGLPEPEHNYLWDKPDSKRHVDYAFVPERVAVEVNEETAHGKWRKQEQDARKGIDLLLRGWVLLRFTGTMLKNDPGYCMDALRKVLEERW